MSDPTVTALKPPGFPIDSPAALAEGLIGRDSAHRIVAETVVYVLASTKSAAAGAPLVRDAVLAAVSDAAGHASRLAASALRAGIKG